MRITNLISRSSFTSSNSKKVISAITGRITKLSDEGIVIRTLFDGVEKPELVTISFLVEEPYKKYEVSLSENDAYILKDLLSQLLNSDKSISTFRKLEQKK